MRFKFAVAFVICKPGLSSWVTDDLNARMARGDGGVYTGGQGVMVRAEDFESSSTGFTSAVAAATFWVNDIFAPSMFYPTAGNTWFPNQGSDGFSSTDWMNPSGVAGAAGPWTWAALGVVVGSKMDGLFPEFDNIQTDEWNWGVFYAADSNAADKRCVWLDDYQGYDCPGYWGQNGDFSPDNTKKGAGAYQMGSPFAGSGKGGGAGCHFDGAAIDQEDSDGWTNLVGNSNCQCNWDLSGNDWQDWFWMFVQNRKPKPGFEDRNWLRGGDKAPAWAMDSAICWNSNPRAMIMMQNNLYWNKLEWNNAMIPKADWYNWDTAEQRKYWGWNEVPADTKFMEDAGNWDTIMIKLPAAVCDKNDGDWGKFDGPECLGTAESQQLELDLKEFVQQGKLLVGAEHSGERPGSHIVFVREYADSWDQLTATASGSPPNLNWQRQFFCANWNSANGLYQVVDSADACYLDNGGSPSPPAPPPTPASPGSIAHRSSGLCVEGDDYNGAPVVANQCNSAAHQNWKFNDDGSWKELGSGKCVDVPGADFSEGTLLEIWECNGLPQQQFGYDSDMGTIYLWSDTDATWCVDLLGGGGQGASLQLWGCNNGENQKFDLAGVVVA